MESEINILYVERWTDDPAQQEKFLTLVGPKIVCESRYMANRYRVGNYYEDIASDIRAQLLERMHKRDADGPFAKDSATEAASLLLDSSNFQIREWARPIARKIGRRQSRQADVLAGVREPDLPQDIATQLLSIARGLPLVISEARNLTSMESKVFRMESLRRAGVDDLPAEIFDQAAQASGISSSELREFNKDHEQQGHLSEAKRKTWSRARAKVKNALSRAKVASLLAIVFALSLALFNATHQDRFIHQPDVAHQGGNLIHQPDVAEQSMLAHQTGFAHQSGNFVHQPDCA